MREILSDILGILCNKHLNLSTSIRYRYIMINVIPECDDYYDDCQQYEKSRHTATNSDGQVKPIFSFLRLEMIYKNI